MQNIQIKRNLKFVTVEKHDAWLVLAFVVEIRDGKSVPVSEPRIVKIIQKKFAVLNGNTQKKQTLSLSAPKTLVAEFAQSVVSPYVASASHLHIKTIPWFSAIPPTL